MKPLYRCFPVLVITSLTFTCLLSGNVFADVGKLKKSEDISESLTDQVNEELSQDLKKELEKIKKRSSELRALQRAQNAGLNELIKRVSPGGGQFEIQPDGAIRIIPKDDSVIKKLVSPSSLPKSPQQSSSSSKTKSKKATSGKSASFASQGKISESEKQIMRKLQGRSDEGLTGVLQKLAPGGGKLELIENEGVKITPDDASKTRELSKASKKAQKVSEEKDLKDLSKSLKRIGQSVNTWRKARKIANQWLKKQKREGLVVGKIRRVNRLYIVSIVTDKGRLDSQIVMRVSDGKAVVFSQKDFEILN